MNLRCVIKPGKTFCYKIQFKPTICGVYKHKYNIEVIGYRTRYTLECQGIADIPSIYTDPEVLFQQVAEHRKITHQFDSNIYYKNSKIFNFGPALITNCPEM